MIKQLIVITLLIVVAGCAHQKSTVALQDIMDNAIKEGIPGLSVAIADKDGLIWVGTAGLADIQNKIPVKDNHLFGIGSISKTFVAVVTLQLVEEGKLSLDQTPVELLGADMAGKVPGADRATIAQLLNHTSGIPSWEDDPVWIREGRGADQIMGRQWRRTETLPYVANTPLTNEAGKKYSYANTNHTLLGLIIEKITSNEITTEIKKRILEPVGIKDIYLEAFEPLPKQRLAKRYHYSTPGFKKTAGVHKDFPGGNDSLVDASASNLSVEWAAGGMVATAADLVKYAAAFRAGKLLTPESMAVVRDWTPITSTEHVGHGLFMRQTDTGHKLLGHRGDVLGYTAAFYWLDKEDISFAVLANVGTMHVGEKLPSAKRLVSSEAFIEQLIAYAKTKRKH